MTEGETMFGTPGINRGIVGVATNSRTTNKPGLVHFQTYDGSSVLDFYIWVDSNGVLRILNAIPTDQNSDGTVVGTQT